MEEALPANIALGVLHDTRGTVGGLRPPIPGGGGWVWEWGTELCLSPVSAADTGNVLFSGHFHSYVCRTQQKLEEAGRQDQG